MLTNLKRCVFFFPFRTHTEHTLSAGGAGLGHGIALGHGITAAGQSRGQGRVHALRLRLAACLHPRALRASTPGSSARGRAQRPGHVDFWQQTRIQATCYRQVRLVCVCVCVRARKHVGTNFIPALTHTVIICVCVCVCVCVCMYVCTCKLIAHFWWTCRCTCE